MNESGKTVVLYHGPACPDGFASAFSAWRALGNSATYLPVNYGDPVPAEAWEAERVYVLDFSYDRDTLQKLVDSSVRGVTVLDHHKSARESLLDALGDPGLEIIFDLEKSGAILSWEHFHPRRPVPLLLKFIDDRDRWVWKLPRSREVSAWLQTVDRDFATWNAVVSDFTNLDWYRADAVSRGNAVLKVQRQHVESLAAKAHWVEIAGHRVPAVNSPLFQSEIGERLCELHDGTADFAAIYFDLDQEEQVWSLRSRNGFDVSQVAKSFGGGGHPAAAGYRRSRKP